MAEKAQQLQAEELKEMNTNEIIQKINSSLQGLVINNSLRNEGKSERELP